MNDRFRELLRRLGEIHDLEKAAGLLSWDEETKMPPAGADARAEQRATLNRIAHELQVGPELGGLLEELRTFEGAHDYDSFEASLIRVARRDYEKASRIPPDLRAELTRAGSLGYRAWLHAREQEDYAIMLPHLEHNLELRREYIRCFDDHGDPYDVLLDDYEPGMKTADVEVIFAQLKAALVPMLRAVADAPPVDDSCLRGRFPRDAQRRFSVSVLERWGMDRAAWRLDRTVHPFAMSMSSSDIRLTTNFQEDSPHGILSCLHEFGHGVYERQIDARYDRTPLGHGVSAALHESQSRLWENLVGRSLATWKFFYPQLQQSFPEQFAGVPLERFHRALNKVQASLRRVDADEVTYCLHIILRFELERDILYGNVELRDLPEAFDAKMREYLGLEPPDVSHGVLQDVHWSDMGLGYFPTYALGNVVSVQLWERAIADLGDLDEQFERGEFGPLRDWLGTHVHRHGRVFTPQELLQRAAGGTMDPAPYLGYLERKLGELFGAAVA
ncbi:MAG TPA: carboxypeptidase M32 [Gaiellaceae bacterium]|nr:carboxypeptidase M32 [Gaiellaceae bacterium]